MTDLASPPCFFFFSNRGCDAV